MDVDDNPTDYLMRMLLNEPNIHKFIRAADGRLSVASLKAFLNRLCAVKDTLPARVIDLAGIERPYGHQLFNGTRKNPSRDKIIQLAFGFGLSVDETQQLLKIARKSELYVKVPRDAVFIHALQNKIPVSDVNATLAVLEMPALEKSDI